MRHDEGGQGALYLSLHFPRGLQDTTRPCHKCYNVDHSRHKERMGGFIITPVYCFPDSTKRRLVPPTVNFWLLIQDLNLVEKAPAVTRPRCIAS